MLYGVYLYLLGASLRRCAEALEAVCPRSKTAVHDWVQRLGGFVRARFHVANGDLPDTVVVDETALQIGSEYWTLWVAVDPETRAVYHLALSETPTLLDCRGFFEGIYDRYGRYPERVVTDRGPWYVSVLRRLGIAHDVVSGGIRSYVERWIETLKDRSRAFDRYHPCHGGGCDRGHVLNWAFLVAFHYNHARRHESRGLSPPLAEGAGSCWSLFVERVGDALS